MVFSESYSLGEIGSLTYKDVKRLFCGGGADIGAIELDKENQKMVVMCDADNAGWGTETMEGLVATSWGTWCQELQQISDFSWMLKLLSVMHVVDKVDTVTEMVNFVDHVARVRAVVNWKVVMKCVVISNPINLNMNKKAC